MGIQDAITKAGSQAKLARLLDTTPQTVNSWIARKRVPLERAIQIERVLGIPKEQMRPDVFGS
jgi:DNA-binding transcriptional regulator YdaS (Cro superfamily)